MKLFFTLPLCCINCIAKYYCKDILDENRVFGSMISEYLLEKNMIAKEEEAYIVPKFNMVAFKLLDDKIFCDDKDSVSVINP